MNIFYDGHQNVDKQEGKNLPHWSQDGKISFITFRLADSLPANVMADITASLAQYIGKDDYQRRRLATMMKYMDAGYGDCLLVNEETRKVVERTVNNGNGSEFQLHAGVIMPNHVHLLLIPARGVDLQTIVQQIKNVSAHAINKMLSRKGALWQIDFFDRLIRSNESYIKTIEYIEHNPTHCPHGSASLYSKDTDTWEIS